MKLSAVTICINYADYLESVIENRRHFDRWVIMTIAADRETHTLCERYGLECRDSALLRDAGDFHAVTNKGPILNEALDTFEKESWAVVIDADVLLPSHFRERVEALPLEPGALYGMAGRKICHDRENLEMLRRCEPWSRLVGRNSQPLGYFNLFYLGAKPNRYPRRMLSNTSSHDDWLFTTSFAASMRRTLPMVAIHAGSNARNWAGRVTEDYRPRRATEPSSLPASFARTQPGNAEPPSAAVIGYFPGGRWKELVKGYGGIWLIDQFQIHAPSGSAMLEADRGALRRIFAREISGVPGLRLAGPHSARTISEIPDQSIDLLYLAGEVAPDWLSLALPHWQPKFKDGAVICGDLFGLPQWPDATYTVSLLIGTPEHVAADGFWWKRNRAVESRVMRPVPRVRQSGGDGVAFANIGRGRLEALLISLQSVRRHWAGPVHVFHWGKEEEALRIICARLGVELRQVNTEPDHTHEDFEEALEESCWLSSFRRGIFLLPGMLAVRPLEQVFNQPSEGWTAFRGEPRLVAGQSLVSGRPAWERFDFSAAQTYLGPAVECGSIIVYSGDPAEWTDPAWETWCECEAEMALAHAAEVRVPSDAAVAAIITPENAGEFQRNWLSWRFPAGTPVLLLFAGLAPGALWLPEAGNTVRRMRISSRQRDNLPALLGKLIRACQRKKLIILPTTAAALPGAELWTENEWTEVGAALHSIPEAREEETSSGNRFLPQPAFGMFSVAMLQQAAELPEARIFGYRELPILLRRAFDHSHNTSDTHVDMTRHGWSLPPTHLFWRRRLASEGSLAPPRLKTSSPHKRQARSNQTGLMQRQLADEVVVISLPERTDRRTRIESMMAQERVPFRFVDGVRVTTEEIQPEEIAHVGWRGFKLAAGKEAYLRGMVGCRRAHIRVLECARDNGLRSILVMEDDAAFVDGWYERFLAAKAELPQGWLQLYFSAGSFRPSTQISRHLHRLRAACQTTAILYSEEGIEAGLKCLHSARSEIDFWMALHIHPFGCSYSIHPQITWQTGGYSDILSYNKHATS